MGYNNINFMKKLILFLKSIVMAVSDSQRPSNQQQIALGYIRSVD
jgi:hypothetical protein